MLLFALVLAMPVGASEYERAPQQAVDQAYTDLIAKYTTDPALNSPLTDYLPASDTVPTPLDVFGRIAGANAHNIQSPRTPHPLLSDAIASARQALPMQDEPARRCPHRRPRAVARAGG